MRAERPTLLIFTLGPDREAFRRRLLPRPLARFERSLWSAGLEAAIAAGCDAGCRVVVSSPDPLPLPAGIERIAQLGGGFAERLAAAVAAAGEGGPLVVVGTDVPGLGAEQIRSALELLAAGGGRIAVGPSQDGGIYLLATAHPLAGLVGAVSWCSASTLASLRAVVQAAGFEVALLPALADLDRRRDLDRFLAAPLASLATLWRDLARLLAELLAELCQPLVPATLGLRLAAAPLAASGRAPPRAPR